MSNSTFTIKMTGNQIITELARERERCQRLAIDEAKAAEAYKLAGLSGRHERTEDFATYYGRKEQRIADFVNYIEPTRVYELTVEDLGALGVFQSSLGLDFDGRRNSVF